MDRRVVVSLGFSSFLCFAVAPLGCGDSAIVDVGTSEGTDPTTTTNTVTTLDTTASETSLTTTTEGPTSGETVDTTGIADTSDTDPTETDPSDTDDTRGSSESTTSGSSDSASSESSTTFPDSTDTSDTNVETGVVFIIPVDGGGVSLECDIWAQDCPDGEKCMPWANDGGSNWNATRCSPLDPNPGQPGDVCQVEGSGVSGIDDCDIAAMCWNVDPETNMGECIAMCMGSPQNPVCENPETTCTIINDGVLILCLDSCDPLVQDCDGAEVCVPVDDAFVCAPDASGQGGQQDDPCQNINVCDPGLLCVDASVVPNCGGGVGCCTTLCDFSDGGADAMCLAEVGAGTACLPFYEEGQAPPGYEDVGICATP